MNDFWNGFQKEAALKPEIRKYVDEVKEFRGLKTKVIDGGSFSIAAGKYDILKDEILVPSNVQIPVIAHELGHADSIGRLQRSGKIGDALSLGITLAPLIVGGGSLAAAALSSNPSVRKFAPLVALASTLPLLTEEARANMLALTDIERNKGEQAANTARPYLWAGYSNYLLAAGLLTGATHGAGILRQSFLRH